MDVGCDVYFHENSLFESGAVDKAVAQAPMGWIIEPYPPTKDCMV